MNLVRPFLAGPAGSPRSGTRLVGTGPKGHPVPAGPRFSSLKIAPGGTLPSASKGANQIPRLTVLPDSSTAQGQTEQAVTAGAISKRRVDRRIRDDRAGCPIEAAQYQGCTVRPVPSRSAWLRGQSRRDR